MAKKNDKVAAARKAFVQARVAKTGKMGAEDKAKFRQRFETLAASPEGRKKIADITGIAGVRKELKSAYSKPPTTATKTTTTTSSSSKPVVTPTPKTSEAKTEAALRASAKPTFSTPATKTTQTPPMKEKSLSGIQKVLIGTGAAAATYGLSNRAFKLQQIANLNAKMSGMGMNAAEVQAQLRGLGYKPKSLGSVARTEGMKFLGRFGGGGSILRGR